MTLDLSRRTLLAGTVSFAGLGLLGTRLAPAAHAGVTRPDIIGCDTWGAKPATGSISMLSAPSTIVIHHTDTANTTNYSRDAALAIARSIQAGHLKKEWIDTGQHFTVSRGGYVLEGRHRTLGGLDGGKRQFPQGAHARGGNDTSLGIENEGNYVDGLPPAQQWDALIQLCAYLCQAYGLTASAIEGHRDVSSTVCPGKAFYAELPRLRSDVAAALGAPDPGDPTPSERVWPKLREGSTGFQVKSAQHLLRHAGQSVEVTGTYGSTMTPKVKAFQSAEGLTADGVIGRLTWEAPLAVKVRDGDRGEAARALQVALAARGQSVTVDGVVGSKTITALKAYQSSASLSADGVAGPNTWASLLNE